MSGEPAATPNWLLQPQFGLCPCGCIGRRRKGSFVAKTLNGIAVLLRQTMFSSDLAAAPGLLQRIEPRVKLLSILGLLLTAAFVRNIPVLAGMYLVALVLAVASALPLGFFVRRVWLFIPIFTGIVVVPATFNVVTHGTVVVPLGTWFGHPLGLTSQGLTAAGLIVLRVAVSISLVVLLTSTTPWHRLLASLRAVFVPRIFIVVLAMAYRYIFVLLSAVIDMYTARLARSVTDHREHGRGRRFVASSAGALFGRAHALADDVHLAMIARGFVGDVPRGRTSRPTWIDAGWLLGVLAVAVATLTVDRLLGR